MDSKDILRILSRDKNNTFSLIKTEHTRFTCWHNLLASQEETEAGMGRSKSWYGSVKRVSKISMRLRGKQFFFSPVIHFMRLLAIKIYFNRVKRIDWKLDIAAATTIMIFLTFAKYTRKMQPSPKLLAWVQQWQPATGSKTCEYGQRDEICPKITHCCLSTWSWKIKGESSAGQQMKLEPVLALATRTGL